jgi:anti-sigma factor RsiW
VRRILGRALDTLRPCSRNQDALIDLLEERTPTAAGFAPLEHLERCPRCEREMEALALTIAALRRLAVEARQLDPSREAWYQLRGRIERPAPPRSLTLRMAGGVLSGALLFAAVAPLALVRPSPPATAEDWVPVRTGGTPHSRVLDAERSLRREESSWQTVTSTVEAAPRLVRLALRADGVDARAARHAPTLPRLRAD